MTLLIRKGDGSDVDRCFDMFELVNHRDAHLSTSFGHVSHKQAFNFSVAELATAIYFPRMHSKPRFGEHAMQVHLP